MWGYPLKAYDISNVSIINIHFLKKKINLNITLNSNWTVIIYAMHAKP